LTVTGKVRGGELDRVGPDLPRVDAADDLAAGVFEQHRRPADTDGNDVDPARSHTVILIEKVVNDRSISGATVPSQDAMIMS
jgi:hypothetical protein